MSQVSSYPNFRITDVSFDADEGSFVNALGGEEFYLGDFIGLAMADNTAYAAWTDTRFGNQDIFFARYPIDPAPAPHNDRFEPNETPENPTQLGRVLQRTLPKLVVDSRDEDWFRFHPAITVDFGVSITVDGEPPTSTDDLRLEFWEEGGTEPLATGGELLDAAGHLIGRELHFPTNAGENYLVRVVGPDEGGRADASPRRYSLELDGVTADLGMRAFASVSGDFTSGGGDAYLVTAAASGSLEMQIIPGDDVDGNLKVEILDLETFEVKPTKVERGQIVVVLVSGEEGASGHYTLQVINLDQFTTPDSATLLFPAGAGPSATAFGDFNGDHKVDLVVANALSNTISVLLGNGDGTFQAPRQFATGAFATPNTVVFRAPLFGRELAIADVSSDQILDVVVTNFDSSDISVLLGRGDGTFEPQRRIDATSTPFALDAGDLNLDGIIDLVVADSPVGRGVTNVIVLLGRGDGTFAPQPTLEVQTGAALPLTGVRLADFSADGTLDLILSGDNTPGINLFLGNGDGTFAFQGRFDAMREAPDTEVADLDDDGNVDIVVGSFDERGQISILLGNGNGTFQKSVDLFAGQSVLDVEIVDFTRPEDSDGSGPDGKLDIVVAASGIPRAIQVVGGPEVVVLPGIFEDDDEGNLVLFGLPRQLAPAKAPIGLDASDVNGDGAVDIAVVDRDGILLVFGKPPVIPPNNTPASARDLGTVVHLVNQTQTIVPDHEDAYFRFTVPTDAVGGAGDEIVDISALFEAEEGAGLEMEVFGAAGNLRGSGERFRVRAAQGEELLLHVFAVEGEATGETPVPRGAGAYTLVIDVLPQVVAVEAQSLLPGVDGRPGGPTTSMVLTFQGDRLDPTTAEDPGNYTVTHFGSDGLFGTADDRVIPLGFAAGGRPIIYNASSNVDVATGLTYPTAVRQTVTLSFAEALPAGSYVIDLSADIQADPFNAMELDQLAERDRFNGHPVVSQVGDQIVEGARIEAIDLVHEAGPLGDFSDFEAGTPFLTQLHDDLGALLDAVLTQSGDESTVTAALIDQVLARLEPALGAPGERPTTMLVIVLDPPSTNLLAVRHFVAPRVTYDKQENSVTNTIPGSYFNVTGNIVLFVDSNAFGTNRLVLDDVAPSTRGVAIVLGNTQNSVINLTPDIRSGQRSFSFTIPLAVPAPQNIPTGIFTSFDTPTRAVDWIGGGVQQGFSASRESSRDPLKRIQSSRERIKNAVITLPPPGRRILIDAAIETYRQELGRGENPDRAAIIKRFADHEEDLPYVKDELRKAEEEARRKAS